MIIILGKKFRLFAKMIFILIILALIAINSKWIFETIYPMHYNELIEKYSAIYSVDPYLAAAIIRNESKFNPNALSRKDAKGLMQIAPVTGQWASERLEIKNYSEEQLYEPELNIQIGTWYLNVLHKEFNGSLELMVAAYNAGNGNVSKWLENPEYSPDGRQLSHIPFPETRLYSKKVLRDYEIYSRLYQSRGGLAFVPEAWEIMSIYFRSLDI